MMSIKIEAFFDAETASYTYIVIDESSLKAAIIDSVLNYDPYAANVLTTSADKVIEYVKTHSLNVEWILETHIHADHLTAAHYLKSKLGGKIGIGSAIKKVLDYWVPIFNTQKDTPLEGSQFDCLFEDDTRITLGATQIQVLHTPGHTPACCSYLIEEAVFVGDTIFMPDIGTARTDFPGGSAAILFDSIQRIFALPDTTRVFFAHDYPPEDRQPKCMSTVYEEKQSNILINAGVTKESYVAIRNIRDLEKAVPKLLLPAIQVNLRAGSFGNSDENGIFYLRIPLNQF